MNKKIYYQLTSLLVILLVPFMGITQEKKQAQKEVKEVKEEKQDMTLDQCPDPLKSAVKQMTFKDVELREIKKVTNIKDKSVVFKVLIEDQVDTYDHTMSQDGKVLKTGYLTADQKTQRALEEQKRKATAEKYLGVPGPYDELDRTIKNESTHEFSSPKNPRVFIAAVSDTGEIRETLKEIEPAALPEQTGKILKKKYPDNKITLVLERKLYTKDVGKPEVSYQIRMDKPDKGMEEIEISQDGKVQPIDLKIKKLEMIKEKIKKASEPAKSRKKEDEK